MSNDTTTEPRPVPAWTIGDRLAKARRAAGLNQSEMAERIRIGRRSITRYEQSDSPPWPILAAYSEVTGVPIYWIEKGTGDPSEQGVTGSGWYRHDELVAVCARIAA